MAKNASKDMDPDQQDLTCAGCGKDTDTSTELRIRAPDPTLDACSLGLIFIEYDRGTYTAHRADTSPERIDADVTICGKPDRRLRGFEPAAAAYIAVPCHTCFPARPPLGRRWKDSISTEEDPHLAWQVTAK